MTDREALLYNCEREVEKVWLLVAADWFAEHDEPDMERGLRWMAKWDKRPHPIPNDYPDNGETKSWMLTCFGGIKEGLPHAALPRRLCKHLNFWEWRCWRTWEAAVLALGQALAGGDVECVGDPHQCDPDTLEAMDRHNAEVRAALADLGVPHE